MMFKSQSRRQQEVAYAVLSKGIEQAIEIVNDLRVKGAVLKAFKLDDASKLPDELVDFMRLNDDEKNKISLMITNLMISHKNLRDSLGIRPIFQTGDFYNRFISHDPEDAEHSSDAVRKHLFP